MSQVHTSSSIASQVWKFISYLEGALPSVVSVFYIYTTIITVIIFTVTIITSTVEIPKKYFSYCKTIAHRIAISHLSSILSNLILRILP